MKNNRHQEIVSYIITGGITTLVNYVVFFVLLKLYVHWMVANTLAWVGAVLFSYIVNRRYVFKSDRKDSGKELVEFIGLRFITLLIENVLLYGSIQVLHWDVTWSKIIVSILTVLGNYIFCKRFIFRVQRLKSQD